MKKSTANSIAAEAYRLFLTTGKTETNKRDYSTQIMIDEDLSLNSVHVMYYDEKKDDTKSHYCQIRKSWAKW